MDLDFDVPSKSDNRSVYADWLEVQALVSSTRRASGAMLASSLGIAGEVEEQQQVYDSETNEYLDNDILDQDSNDIIDAAFEELEYRERVVGSSYPFQILPGKIIVAVEPVEALSIDHAAYVFCLLVSVLRENNVHPTSTESTDALKDLTKEVALVFQICACLAAGGFTGGAVSSFGFPRATGTGFYPALKQAYERFGYGEVRDDSSTRGAAMTLKDGGIDVIAWRDHPDFMAGKLYLLGQCASGANWKQKSVIEYIEQLHVAWFSRQPASTVLPAMFIPFTFHGKLSESRLTSFVEDIKDEYWYQETRFGIIFDRLRIAHYVRKCFEIGNSGEVEGADKSNEVQEWIDEMLRLARGDGE